MTTTTKNPRDAAFFAALALLEAIAALGSVPNGHLYVRLMNDMNINTYNQLIGGLAAGGFITNDHDLLTITAKGTKVAADFTKATSKKS